MPSREELLEILQPGDVLLYRSKGIIPFLIRTKTWSDVNHTEIYVKNGLSAASRDGKGVNTYQLRTEGLLYILRYKGEFDFEAGFDWHRTVTGRPYDFWGLLAFFNWGSGGHPTKYICSEHTTEFLGAGKAFPFGEDYPPHKVSPGDYLKNNDFLMVRRYDG